MARVGFECVLEGGGRAMAPGDGKAVMHELRCCKAGCYRSGALTLLLIAVLVMTCGTATGFVVQPSSWFIGRHVSSNSVLKWKYALNPSHARCLLGHRAKVRVHNMDMVLQPEIAQGMQLKKFGSSVEERRRASIPTARACGIKIVLAGKVRGSLCMRFSV